VKGVAATVKKYHLAWRGASISEKKQKNGGESIPGQQDKGYAGEISATTGKNGPAIGKERPPHGGLIGF